MTKQAETPLTDDEARAHFEPSRYGYDFDYRGNCVPADFARTLERRLALQRELTAKNAEIAALREREERAAVAFVRWLDEEAGKGYHWEHWNNPFAAFCESEQYKGINSREE